MKMENRKKNTHTKLKTTKKKTGTKKNIFVVSRPGRKDVPLATYN